MIRLLPPPKNNRSEHPFVGRIDYQGIPIAVENRKGSYRSGVDGNGQKWRVKMHAHYGEVWGWGTRGTDGDKLDVYVMDDPDSKRVYIIDQVHPDGPHKGQFDEHKVILGARSRAEAVRLYRRQYDRPGFLGKVHEMTLEQFKRLCHDRKKRGKRLVKRLILRGWKKDWNISWNKFGRRILLVKAVPRSKKKWRPLPRAVYPLLAAAMNTRRTAPHHIVRSGGSYKITGGSPIPNEWRVSLTRDGSLYRYAGRPEPKRELPHGVREIIKHDYRYSGPKLVWRQHGHHLDRAPRFTMWLMGPLRKSIWYGPRVYEIPRRLILSKAVSAALSLPRAALTQTARLERTAPEKPLSVRPLFETRHNSLPGDARQPTADKESLYQHAHEAREHLFNILDREQGVGAKLGYHTIDAEKEQVSTSEKLKEPGKGAVIIGPIKGEERAAAKVHHDLEGDWSRITDLARASVAVDDHNDLHPWVGHLEEAGMRLARRPKDRFLHPSEDGYRDALTHWHMPNGHVAEIQFHVKPILEAKDAGHRHYEANQAIERRANAENRELTPEERKEHEGNTRKMRDLYDAAMERALRGLRKAVSLRHHAAYRSQFPVRFHRRRYYDWHGLPAYRDSSGHFPRVWRHGEWTREPELSKFQSEAHPIGRAAFKRLLREHR